MSKFDVVRLSKQVSYTLRHAPEKYGLELDREGWCRMEDLLLVLRNTNQKWKSLRAQDLEEMIECSDKIRFEIAKGRIRALYGHSIPVKVTKEPAMPPALLYHGTSPNKTEQIRKKGLLPMGRQYVHLSVDRQTAMQVGSRKSNAPVILTVKAIEAFKSGISFYHGSDAIWLADFVPQEFIDIDDGK